MATLKNQRGQPLLGADGQEIKEGSTRRKPTVRMESKMQRVRRERRELHSAVGSERCAGQSPTASQSPQSLQYSM